MAQGSEARKGRRIAVVVALAVLLAAGVGIALWTLRGGAERSVAREHLPADCEAVARVDLEGLREVGPIAEHVMPALDEAARESDDAGKMARFFLSAGLDPRKDLHEVALCVSDLGSDPEVVVIVGGRLRPGGVVDALEAQDDELDDIDIERVIAAGGRDILVTKSGLFITQADDGAIVIGTSQKRVEAALAPSAAYERYDLPERQVVAVITADAVKKVGKQASSLPFAQKLGGAGRALVTVDLAEREAVVELDMGDAAAAEDLSGALRSFLRLARLVPRGDPVTRLLVQTEFAAQGTRTVGTLDIPKEAVEDAAKQLAERIRNAND